LTLVVSDTSPIRAMAYLQLLDVLAQLFGDVLVPPKVAAELRTPPSDLPRVEVAQLSFVRVQAPVNQAKVLELHQTLDLGESEALVLALEVNAEAVLIDEMSGRKIATDLGLSPVGVLGILVKAKARGRVSEIRPLVDKLREELNFFVSNEVYLGVLRLAGEEMA